MTLHYDYCLLVLPTVYIPLHNFLRFRLETIKVSNLFKHTIKLGKSLNVTQVEPHINRAKFIKT